MNIIIYQIALTGNCLLFLSIPNFVKTQSVILLSSGYKKDSIINYGLFTFIMTSKLDCNDFICTIVYSLMS